MACVLLECFEKFLPDPYYVPLPWYMIIIFDNAHSLTMPVEAMLYTNGKPGQVIMVEASIITREVVNDFPGRV